MCVYSFLNIFNSSDVNKTFSFQHVIVTLDLSIVCSVRIAHHCSLFSAQCSIYSCNIQSCSFTVHCTSDSRGDVPTLQFVSWIHKHEPTFMTTVKAVMAIFNVYAFQSQTRSKSGTIKAVDMYSHAQRIRWRYIIISVKNG